MRCGPKATHLALPAHQQHEVYHPAASLHRGGALCFHAASRRAPESARCARYDTTGWRWRSIGCSALSTRRRWAVTQDKTAKRSAPCSMAALAMSRCLHGFARRSHDSHLASASPARAARVHLQPRRRRDLRVRAQQADAVQLDAQEIKQRFIRLAAGTDRGVSSGSQTRGTPPSPPALFRPRRRHATAASCRHSTGYPIGQAVLYYTPPFPLKGLASARNSKLSRGCLGFPPELRLYGLDGAGRVVYAVCSGDAICSV